MMVKRVPGLNVTVVPVMFSAVSISSARTWRVNSYVFWLIGLWIEYAILPFCCLVAKFQICREEWGGFWRFHPALIAVFVTDGHARFTYPDGKTEDVKAKTGQVMYFPPLEHLPENLSDKPFEVIGIELKVEFRRFIWG